MRVKISAIVALAFVVAVGCAPAAKETATDVDDDVEILKKPSYGDQPIVDTGVLEGPILFNPFSGFFQSLESMMLRMRQQMAALLNHLPGRNATTLEERFPVIPFPELGGFDLDKGNTTSVTKVIDGHKVVINETEYKQEGDLGGSYFKIRVIDVQPESGETTEKDSESISVKDRESVEDTVENEIPKSKEAPIIDNIETFDEVDFPFSHGAYGELEDLEPFDSYSRGAYRPFDLSNDIRINDWAARVGMTPNPDAELVGPSRYYPAVETFAPINTNELPDARLSARQPAKGGLHRDTYVNELLSRNPQAINPDAEFFDPIDAEIDFANRHKAKYERIITPR